jgi:hypothetical protein
MQVTEWNEQRQYDDNELMLLAKLKEEIATVLVKISKS